MDGFFDLVIMLLGAAVFIFVLSGASERVTEVVKSFLRKISKDQFPHGDWSKILSLIPAIGAVYGLDVEFFSQFELFSDLDPEMLQILNAMSLWIASNWFHPKAKKWIGEKK